MNPNDDDAVLSAAIRRALALDDAPPALVHAAIRLWPAHGLGLAGALRRVMAALSFDSAAGGTPALATRGAGTRTRHLLFSAEGRDIDLRVTRIDDVYQLAGQVLGPDDSGSVEMAPVGQPASGVARASLDALGSFVIDGMRAGAYDIQFLLGDDAIALPVVELGTQAPDPSSSP